MYFELLGHYIMIKMMAMKKTGSIIKKSVLEQAAWVPDITFSQHA